MERKIQSYSSSRTYAIDPVQSMVKRAFLLLAASVFTCAAVGYMSLVTGFVSQGLSLGAIIAVMVLANFVTPRLGDTTLGYLSVLGIGALLGVAVVPTVYYYFLVKGLAVVVNALLTTSVLFASLSAYALISKKDFTNIGGFLVSAMLAAVVVSLVNAFFFHSPMAQLVVSYIVAAASSGLILYRISAAVKYGVSSSVDLAVGLLIDCYNLFISILNILGNRD